MDNYVILTKNAITAQKHLSREDMSLVLHSVLKLMQRLLSLCPQGTVSDFRFCCIIMYMGFLNLFLVPYFCHYEEEHDEGGGHCSELWVQSCA